MLGISDQEKQDITSRFIDTNWEDSFSTVSNTGVADFTKVIGELKEAIASIYTDGVDDIVGVPKLQGDGITGYFRSGKEFFEFQIDTNTGDIAYHQVDARVDSYLIGCYLGDIAPYIPPENLRRAMVAQVQHFDSARKRCIGGIACGATCISKKAKCSMRLGVSQKQQVLRVRQTLASSDSTRAALLAGGVAGGAIALGTLGGAATVASFEQRRRAAEDRQVAESERIRASEELEEAARLLRMTQKQPIKPTTTPAKKARKIAGAALRAAVPAAIAASTTGNPVAAGAVASAVGLAAGVAAAKELTNMGAQYLEEGELPVRRRPKKRSSKSVKS